MTATDELPRGLLLSDAPAINGAAAVTFPATPGVAWVLTDVTWNAYADGETIAQQGTIEISSAATVLEQLDAFIINAQSGWQKDSGSWQGAFAGAVGKDVTVTFSGGISGGYEQLTASAYPI